MTNLKGKNSPTPRCCLQSCRVAVLTSQSAEPSPIHLRAFRSMRFRSERGNSSHRRSSTRIRSSVAGCVDSIALTAPLPPPPPPPPPPLPPPPPCRRSNLPKNECNARGSKPAPDRGRREFFSWLEVEFCCYWQVGLTPADSLLARYCRYWSAPRSSATRRRRPRATTTATTTTLLAHTIPNTVHDWPMQS
jgi:hypothetical protein